MSLLLCFTIFFMLLLLLSSWQHGCAAGHGVENHNFADRNFNIAGVTSNIPTQMIHIVHNNYINVITYIFYTHSLVDQ